MEFQEHGNALWIISNREMISHCFYLMLRDLITLQKVMNRELKKVKKWLDANQLALNIDKTNFVIFHSPQEKIAEQIVINFMKKKIQQKISVKFLGVLLDSNWRLKSHITELSKKLSRTTGSFCKIRHFVPLEILKALYFPYFILLYHMALLFGHLPRNPYLTLLL